MDLHLKDHTAVVVGGASGIGLATAEWSLLRSSGCGIYKRRVYSTPESNVPRAMLPSRFQSVTLKRARLDSSIASCRLREAIGKQHAESCGLSEMWRGDDVTAVSLPMLGVADSLNISTTAAVLFYEALRQRAVEAGDGLRLR